MGLSDRHEKDRLSAFFSKWSWLPMYTRCPHCDTVFRVTPQQLQVSSGQVRCGRCHMAFDAFATLSAQPPARAPSDTSGAAQPAPKEAQAATLEEQSDWPPPQSVVAEPRSRLHAPPGPPAPIAQHRSDVDKQQSLTLPDELFPPGLTPPQRRRPWIAVNLALIALLAGQAAWFFPTQIAMQMPTLRPALQTFCGWLGCALTLPRLPEQLFIEASELQLLDVARPNQVLLTATVRNRAQFAQEYPLLELTLTGTANQTAARRVFRPGEYLDTAVERVQGIGPNQEVAVRLYLDTADLNATGYRLYLFFA